MLNRPGLWAALALSFLVYPQLAYLHGARSAEPRRAEVINFGAECVLYGFWSGLLGFPHWVTFVLFTAGSVNLTYFLGGRGYALGSALFAGGAGLGWLTGGRVLHTETHPTTTLAGLGLLTVYLAVIARDANQRLFSLHAARAQTQEAERQVREQLARNVALQVQLREQAVRDPLTGLFNRRYLDPTLTRELARSRREGTPVAAVFMDLDHFKRINDTYGHPAGDAVLIATARLIEEHCRAEDVPCRVGGEEFVVLLPRMPLAIARQRAESWRQMLASRPLQVGNAEIRCTMSVGVAAFPDHASDTAELLALGDAALYRAKTTGRDRVCVAVRNDAPMPGAGDTSTPLPPLFGAV